MIGGKEQTVTFGCDKAELASEIRLNGQKHFRMHPKLGKFLGSEPWG